ncbi:MFS transporter [Chryseobacterium sp. SSA4.19]|uniref:MFS transporter n=1 Tax=Chryseobacterium sp. SSA4.19 TaxID=2919915 RepID=UPI001F4D8D72|nr:MFS transporter [Chryseobacterium sp. SSA4.19]MCJ8155090.1 MFS transporter [Chryseobacterium sp. SSA4.19]
MGKVKLNKFYRSFLYCTCIGALGEYMALTTLSWYLLETYNDLSIIGKVLSFRIIPRFFMGFVGGYLADLHNKRKMMILLYFLIMCTSLLQTILISVDDQPAWYYLAGILFLRSVFDGAEPSIRNAILPHIADKSMITKAVGYYATGLNLAAIGAPILAALLIQYFQIHIVFWIDWLLQIPSFIILFKIPKITEAAKQGIKRSFISSYKEALCFIYHSEILMKCFIVSILMMLVMFPFDAMISIYVKNVLLSDIKNFGYLSAVEAVGAVLAGSILHRVFKNNRQGIRMWYLIGLFCGVLLIILSIRPEIIFIYAILFLLGLFSQLFRSYSRVLFQEKTPDHLRGKVMSVIISDSSLISVGLLLFTYVAEITTVTKSFLAMGICSVTVILVALIISRRRKPQKYLRV